MKTNKLTKKIIVSTLAVAMGAALVGSISGTVAWYQYSTRVTAQMSGTSAGTSRNLQISSSDAVVSDKDNAAWDYNVAPAKKADMAPSTVEVADGVVTGHYEHPVYQYFTAWKAADEADYFSYDLYFQSLKQGNVREAVDVYLTKFELKDNSGNDLTGIVAEALRIQFAVYTYDGSDWTKESAQIFAKTAGTTTTSDYLNLNNRDGGTNYNMDHNGFRADDEDGVATKYQAGTSTSYTTVDPTTLIADDSDPYAFSGGTALFTTGETYAVKVSVKVWIEGWQRTATNPSVTVPEGTDATGYFTDDACETAANNYHSAGEVEVGVTPAAGLYSDTACETPAAADGNGKIAADGTYYKKGLAAGSVYTKGYIWDDASIGTNFNVNMRFGCEAHR